MIKDKNKPISAIILRMTVCDYYFKKTHFIHLQPRTFTGIFQNWRYTLEYITQTSHAEKIKSRELKEPPW